MVCKYKAARKPGSVDTIFLAADSTCENSLVCTVNTDCKVVSTFDSAVTNFALALSYDVGDMSNYSKPDLTITDLSSVGVFQASAFRFPSTLLSLTLNKDHITSFDRMKLPDGLQNLTLLNCKADTDSVIPFKWPSSLRFLDVQQSDLSIPSVPFPSSLTHLSIQNNINIHELSDRDWTTITSLTLSAITYFDNVSLSSKLTYFSCVACNITHFSVSTTTYSALEALSPVKPPESTTGFQVAGISTDPNECNGTIRPLWAGKTNVNYSVCVFQPTLPPNTTYPITFSAPESFQMSPVAILTVVGSAIVAMVAVAFVLWRWKVRHGDKDDELTDASYRESMSDIGSLRMFKLDQCDLRYTSRRPLATGAHGEVWLGTYFQEKVAIKRNKQASPEALEAFVDEIKLLAKLDCAYIVKFIGVCWIRPVDVECIVEYMNLGDLRSYLSSHSPLEYSWKEKAQSIQSIIYALVYLHTFDPPIIHRDLKSRNVLLDSKKGTKLTDFGISKEIYDAQETMTSGIGTYQWMAPEIITGTRYSEAADIYSFGVILSEFSTHKIPYSNVGIMDNGHQWTLQYILNCVADGTIQPEFNTNCPQWLRTVGNECLAHNPNDRPTALDLTVRIAQFIAGEESHLLIL
ncbi:kinase [Thraustotheca clavata]|uniref:Kinase n=1 Tax=Thraustotheca clavata TaxID=74557 RepID=A0A1W0A904_9STRA|nr:kinase [Thraustotheca clavata]